MQHYQVRKSCGVCNREFIVDIMSFGTQHQQIAGVTCFECYKTSDCEILVEGEVRTIKPVRGSAPPKPPLDDGA